MGIKGKISKKSGTFASKKTVKSVKSKTSSALKRSGKPVLKPSAAAKKTEPRLNAKEIKEIKNRLEHTRQDLIRRLQEKKSFDMPEAEVGDPIDQASQSIDKEILFEVTDNDHLTIDQIEAALRRIEKGAYGVCESCRRVIPKKRLHALPFARYCVNCQISSETSPVSIAIPQ